jgi:hypothetical protein
MLPGIFLLMALLLVPRGPLRVKSTVRAPVMRALFRWWRGAIQAATGRVVDEVSDTTENVGGFRVI